MPDTKITALTAIGANPINVATFPIPMVDLTDTSMAASGTTKKVTVNQILGAGGTATLASATITGDLTVATSTLKVDSANNRVGIGTASPATRFVVSGGRTGLFSGDAFSLALGQTTGQANYLYLGTDASGTLLVSESSGNSVMTLSQSGVCTWLDGAGGTRMTLNSTGLGVGVIPSGTTGNSKISVVGGATYDGNFDIIGNFTSSATASAAKGVLLGYNNSTNNGIISAAYGGGTEGLTFWTHNGSSWGQRMELTATGNVGIGVTPSAWYTTGGYRALQIGNASLYGRNSTNSEAYLSANAFENASASPTYITSSFASRYTQDNGVHKWLTAPSGTAGNAITFTERLRLKETGQLRFVPLASDPSGAEAGDVYYNSTSNKLKCYNGTTWNDLF